MRIFYEVILKKKETCVQVNIWETNSYPFARPFLLEILTQVYVQKEFEQGSILFEYHIEVVENLTFV